MADCASCGATLVPDVAFCGNCGKAVEAAMPALLADAARGAGTRSTTLTANVTGALTYALGFLTGILFLAIEPYKNDRFIRFHAMQSVLFSAGVTAFSIAWTVLWGILFEMSNSLALVSSPVRLLIPVGIFAYWLFLTYQAYLGDALERSAPAGAGHAG